MAQRSWQTKGEMLVGQAFERKNIRVEYQYPLGPYSLDIYLPQYRACVEVRGMFHLTTSRMRRDKGEKRVLPGSVSGNTRLPPRTYKFVESSGTWPTEWWQRIFQPVERSAMKGASWRTN